MIFRTINSIWFVRLIYEILTLRLNEKDGIFFNYYFNLFFIAINYTLLTT